MGGGGGGRFVVSPENMGRGEARSCNYFLFRLIGPTPLMVNCACLGLGQHLTRA